MKIVILVLGLLAVPALAGDIGNERVYPDNFNQGLTIRDYAAIQIMAMYGANTLMDLDHHDNYARYAYKWADALLAARGQRPN